jgi:uncharacterized protein
MHYLLSYELAPDYLARRGEYRTEHLQLAWQATERGELLLAGALAEPADAALLIFQGDSPAAAEAFAKSDPYVTKGLVRSYELRPWNTVVGELAFAPVRP